MNINKCRWVTIIGLMVFTNILAGETDKKIGIKFQGKELDISSPVLVYVSAARMMGLKVSESHVEDNGAAVGAHGRAVPRNRNSVEGNESSV